MGPTRVDNWLLVFALCYPNYPPQYLAAANMQAHKPDFTVIWGLAQLSPPSLTR